MFLRRLEGSKGVVAPSRRIEGRGTGFGSANLCASAPASGDAVTVVRMERTEQRDDTEIDTDVGIK